MEESLIFEQSERSIREALEKGNTPEGSCQVVTFEKFEAFKKELHSAKTEQVKLIKASLLQ